MAINLSSPVTGGPQTGFTSPTYTLAVDQAPENNAKQWVVTALGGTQTGVSVSTGSSPFTLTWFKPRNYRLLGTPNPVTGIISNIPMNKNSLLVRKGLVPLAGQPTKVMTVKCELDIPAGADTASPAEIRAAISLALGALWQMSAGVGDTCINNVS